MDEQQENNAAGNKPESLNPIERAEQILKRLDETERRIDEKTAKLQSLEANRLLSGTAGGRVESQPLPESAKDYANKVLSNKIK